EDRHRDAEKAADRQRQQRAVHRAPDVRQDAELLAADVPRARSQKLHAVTPDRRGGFDADLPDDRREQKQDEPRPALSHDPEYTVGRVIPARGRAGNRVRDRRRALSQELHRARTLELRGQPHWMVAAALRTTAVTFSGSGM